MKLIRSLYNSVDIRLKSAYYSRKDFRTKRHIVVFESDDWGSIRMCGRKGWNELRKLGYAVDKRPYERFDTLESCEDVEALFNVLMKYKDSRGCHPAITANMLMGNPDFEKIKKANYSEYFYEPIKETYNRYYGDAKVLEVMRQGILDGVFMPQSHGREHFNVCDWLNALQMGDNDVLIAFQYGMCGIAPLSHPEQGNNMMVALRARNDTHQTFIETSVSDGLKMFEKTFGFSSQTFVAPCYAWNSEIEQVLSQNGVGLIQAARSSKPVYHSGRHYYYSGQHNGYGQVYSVRNCAFEPATIASTNDISRLLKQIDDRFVHEKIVVISTHRINYVGGLSEENRRNTLSKLDLLLEGLLKKYPDIEFLSSDQLLNIIQ